MADGTVLVDVNRAHAGFVASHTPLATQPPLLLGDRVIWFNHSGAEHGSLRWIGRLPEMGNDWVAGVELDNPAGDHDGRWNGSQLFVAKPRHGLIIPVMGLMKEEEYLENTPRDDSGPQCFRVTDPPATVTSNLKGHYDNLKFTNHQRAGGDVNQMSGIGNNMAGNGDHIGAHNETGPLALQVAASIAAGDIPLTEANLKAKSETFNGTESGTELYKWYDAMDFSNARNQKSRTLYPSSSLTSVMGTEASSSDSKESTKDKGGFFSFLRWFRPSKTKKKKKKREKVSATAQMTEAERLKSTSVHSVTSASSSFQYVAMEFSKSTSNASTLQLNPKLGECGDGYKTLQEQHRDACMKSVVQELKVKMPIPTASPQQTKEVNLQSSSEVSLSKPTSPSTPRVSPNTLPVSSQVNEYDEPRKLKAASGRVSLRQKKRRAPPPPFVKQKTQISDTRPQQEVEASERVPEQTSAVSSPSPSQKRFAYVKGKRKAPSPPNVGNCETKVEDVDNAEYAKQLSDNEQKRQTTAGSKSVTVGSPKLKETTNMGLHIDTDVKTTVTSNVGTNTTLSRSNDKPTMVTASTNTTLIKTPEISPKKNSLSEDSRSSSRDLHSLFDGTELDDDIIFCDDCDEMFSDDSFHGDAADDVDECFCSQQLQSSGSIGAGEDENAHASVTQEWKDRTLSTQNLINMFNSLSCTYEATKWKTAHTSTKDSEEYDDVVAVDGNAAPLDIKEGENFDYEGWDEKTWLASVEKELQNEFRDYDDAILKLDPTRSKGERMQTNECSCDEQTRETVPTPEMPRSHVSCTEKTNAKSGHSVINGFGATIDLSGKKKEGNQAVHVATSPQTGNLRHTEIETDYPLPYYENIGRTYVNVSTKSNRQHLGDVITRSVVCASNDCCMHQHHYDTPDECCCSANEVEVRMAPKSPAPRNRRKDSAFNVLYANVPLEGTCDCPKHDLVPKKSVGCSTVDLAAMYENMEFAKGTDKRREPCNKQLSRDHIEQNVGNINKNSIQPKQRMGKKMKGPDELHNSATWEINHPVTGQHNSRSMSVSSLSSPILSSASSRSSMLSTPPELPKKMGKLRPQRRKSHHVPTTLKEEKITSNKSHVHENSGFATLPAQLSTSRRKPERRLSARLKAEPDPVVVGAIRLQIATKEGQSKDSVNQVLGCRIPTDTITIPKAPIPLPVKRNRKQCGGMPPCNYGEEPNPTTDNLKTSTCRATTSKAETAVNPANLKRTGSEPSTRHPVDNCADDVHNGEREYYNVRVQSGNGQLMQVKRGHSFECKASGVAYNLKLRDHAHKSFASVAVESPLGVVQKSFPRDSNLCRKPLSQCSHANQPPLPQCPHSPSCHSSLDHCHSAVNVPVSPQQTAETGPKTKHSYTGRVPPIPLSSGNGRPTDLVNDVSAIEVNKLLKQLQVAITNGQVEEAPIIARKLAMLKISCSIVRNKPRKQTGTDEEIVLNLFVEDRTSHIGPLSLYVNPSMLVGELKNKIEQQFDFPAQLQQWILGNKVAVDNIPLRAYDVRSNGCPVYLYLKTSDADVGKACKQRLESYLQALEEFEDSDEDSYSIDEHMAAASNTVTRPGDDLEYLSAGEEPHSGGAEVLEIATNVAGLHSGQQEPERSLEQEVGWECPMCTLVNAPTRPGCACCTAERPADYVMPAEYVLKPEEEERLRLEREHEAELEKVKEQQRIDNYRLLVELDDQDVVANDDIFECPVCFVDIGVGEGVRIRDCLHTFCRVCLANAVEYSECAEVKCPYRDNNYSCPSVLQDREIRALVTPAMYDKHLQKSVTTAESQAQNSFHCKSADCPGWCFFEDNINEFLCPVCNHTNCLTCQAIHEGTNCKQYQDRVEFEAATNESARKTKDALEEMLTKGEAMRCPKCQVILMKKWGCDWLKCTMCKTEICWVTKGPRWGPAGTGDISGGCKCGINGVRCHVQCQYCH